MIKTEAHYLCTIKEIIRDMNIMLSLRGIMYEDLIRKLIKEHLDMPNLYPIAIDTKKFEELMRSLYATLILNSQFILDEHYSLDIGIYPIEKEKEQLKIKEILRHFETEYFWDYYNLQPLFPDIRVTELKFYTMYLTRTFKKENKKCVNQNEIS